MSRVADPYPSRRLVLGTRITAFSFGAVGSLGWFELLTGTFNDGMWTILGWFAAAGASLGLRLLPSLRAAGRSPFEQQSGSAARAVLAPTGLDAGILAVISIVVGTIIGFVVGQPEAIGYALFLTFLVGMALCVGFVAGALVVAPLALLLRLLVDAANGRPVAATTALVALMLLTIVGFGIVVGIGSESDPGPGGVGAAGILDVLLGRTVNGTPISPALVWGARALALLIAGFVVALSALARRRNTTSKETIPEEPGDTSWVGRPKP